MTIDTYAIVPEWESRPNQIMTARWLNSLVNNLDWIYNCALYGNPCFRIVKERGDEATAATWKIVWQGNYYHINSTLVVLYDLIRTVSTTEGAYNYNKDYDSIWGDAVNDPDGDNIGPISDDGAAANSDFVICIYVGGAWYGYWGGTWNTPIGSGDYTDTLAPAVPVVDKTDQTVTMDITGLGLTVGSVYPIQIKGRNGGFRIQRIYAYGSAQYAYVALPTVTDGSQLLHSDWNKYVSSLEYLKELVDVPRGPTWGVLKRNVPTSAPNVVWRGNLKHIAETISFRVALGCIGHGMSGYLSCGTSLFWSTAGTEVSNDTPLAYYTSTVDLSALSLAAGTWYTFSYRCYSPSDVGQAVIDYLFEVDGEPAAALLCNQWTEGGYVYGNTAGQDPCMSSLNADFATTKTAAERMVQIPPPDSASSSASWPLATDFRYSANALSWIRQRPQMLWESTISATEEVEVYYGDGDKPSVQSLGVGVSSGITDLDSIPDLTVGTRYWVEPRAKIKYAFETGD